MSTPAPIRNLFKPTIHHLKVISEHLPPKFHRETLNRPWMRLYVFLDEGPLARTPEHYKKFYYDWQCVTPSPVYYTPKKGKWELRPEGRDGVTLVKDFPIPLKYPDELHQGLWGGEAVVKGFTQFIKGKKRRRRVGKYWVPKLKETVVYSEILDKHMKMIVTQRALDLIDDHCGLDNYILKTPSCDLMSELGLKLKREMLFELLHKTMYPNDADRREEIYNKYKEFIIPEEEIEWFALTLTEAHRKQMKLEEKAEELGPYKHIFRKELLQYLKDNPDTGEAEDEKKSAASGLVSRISKLNLFAKSKES